ncbi:MAG: heparinase II/III family protein, partial [Deltaproteobacteria bacterium]|nr:heparinase II/III family protein [Deltaproteobacteria bacterium]
SYLSADSIIVDDFEDVSDWMGLERDDALKMEGNYSGLWKDTVAVKRIRKNFSPPFDLNGYDFLGFWAHSEKANGAKLQIVLDSDNPSDPAGWDYYSKEIVIDFSGWKYFRIPLSSFQASRNPVGWNKINYISFNSDGWNHQPMKDTVLRFDSMVFSQSVIYFKSKRQQWIGDDFVYEYKFVIQNKSQTDVEYSIELGKSKLGFQLYISESVVNIPPLGSREITLLVYITPDIMVPQNYLKSEKIALYLKQNNTIVDTAEVIPAVPVKKREHPYMLADSNDIMRILDWATKYGWAKSQLDSIIKYANNWESNFKTKYGVSNWDLPPEGGQWGMWYVCKNDNSYLTYIPPMTHKCPKCGKVYSGFPYDQVIYTRMHNDLAKAALRLAQSYLFTNEPKYSSMAKDILLRYAQKYPLYPIHDTNNKVTNSGGRVLSQTLDESIWFIDISWAYELLKDGGVFNSEEKLLIENSLLYEGFKVIEKSKAGNSNWQSWHNAAMTAIGFAIDDFGIVSIALNDQSNGFLFQLNKSITSDGFWYEGSWGYHFYALRPLVFTTEMLRRYGIDYTKEESLRRMFELPVLFSEPDGRLPPFNDSGIADIKGQNGLYEFAYNWTGEEIMAFPIDKQSRSYEGIFWGAENISGSGSSYDKSLLLEESGYVIARTNRENPIYLAADFGPHGGWHGHYDKLSFVLYALGKEIAVDSGTHSYALPIHDEYDKSTVAHNTVVVDASNQKEAKGHISYLHDIYDVVLFEIGSDDANDSASLSRNVIVTDRYVYDRFDVYSKDGNQHKYDWVIHLNGKFSGIENFSSPYSFAENKNGYQYLSSTKRLNDEKSDFLLTDFSDNEEASIGSIWSSESANSASFVRDCNVASSGRCSGRMNYDFSKTNKGYILYMINIPEIDMGKLLKVSSYIKGDNSNNSLKIRIYDATDERFVYSVGNINFMDFKKIDATDVENWTHYLGNNDGKIDYPVKNFVVEIGYQSGGKATSSVYVDDIVLTFEYGEYRLADFEIMSRFLGISFPKEDFPVDTIVGTAPVGWGEDVPFLMRRKNTKDALFRTLFCFSDMSINKEDCQIVKEKSIDCSSVACDGAIFKYKDFTDYIIFKEIKDDMEHSRIRIQSEETSFETDGLLGFVRRDNSGHKRCAMNKGSYLSESGVNLIDYLGYLDKIMVYYENDGKLLRIEISDSLSARLRIYAPVAEQVIVNGKPSDYMRDGDYIVLNEVVISHDNLVIEDGIDTLPDVLLEEIYDAYDVNDMSGGDPDRASDVFVGTDSYNSIGDVGVKDNFNIGSNGSSGCSCNLLL